MKIKWKPLLINVAIPLAVGGLSAILTRSQMADFELLKKPLLAPPAVVFPIVWTILYILMGIAAYLVWCALAPKAERVAALRVYGIQLAVNFFWSILFFNLQRYLLSFFWLVLLWVLVLTTLLLFSRIRKAAGRLLVPYLLWVTFAGYLNFAIFILNR